MHVLEPVEVVPAHELDVVLEEGGQPAVIGQQIDVVAIADVLADLLLPRGIEPGGVLQKFVDIALGPRRLAGLVAFAILAALAGHGANSAHPIL